MVNKQLLIVWSMTRVKSTPVGWPFKYYNVTGQTNWNRNDWKQTEWGGDPWQLYPKYSLGRLINGTK